MCLHHPSVEQAGVAFSRAVEQLQLQRSAPGTEEALQGANQSLNHKVLKARWEILPRAGNAKPSGLC